LYQGIARAPPNLPAICPLFHNEKAVEPAFKDDTGGLTSVLMVTQSIVKLQLDAIVESLDRLR